VKSEHHGAVGALASLGAEALSQATNLERPPSAGPDWGRLLLAAIGGFFASALPDLPEPANSPYHRRVCHSATLLVVLVLFGWQYCRQRREANRLIVGAAAGMASHIIGDATTPAGIPLV
jgi:membrane-bound metal-dependent hydrolase YbcI (DUF457 family)